MVNLSKDGILLQFRRWSRIALSFDSLISLNVKGDIPRCSPNLTVDSLFTNIPLKETIDICANLLYNNVDVIEGINKSELGNLLSLATQESYFMLNDILYKQKDRGVMGSPLGLTMTNVFLSFFEVKWLEQCPNKFKTAFYRGYVDYIFVLFKSAEQLLRFHAYLHNVMLICLFHLNKK